MQQTIVVNFSKELLNQFLKKYQKNKIKINSKNDNVLERLKINNVNVTIYKTYKAVFQGSETEVAEITAPLIKKIHGSQGYEPIIGTDEVGTGDYFGPVICVAAFIPEKNYEQVLNLNVRDSKELNDSTIIDLSQKLKLLIKYKAVVINNDFYNRFIAKGLNSNAIKALGHNQVINQLLSEVKIPTKIIIDQFTPKPNYLSYLQKIKKFNQSLNIVDHVTLVTKAENKYVSVACAAIIARAIFLKQINLLSKKWNLNFPLGANEHVDEIARQFIKRFGEENLASVAKIHFKNTVKAKN